jgi:hypothetical protein
MMPESIEPLIRRQLRSPRAAAIAGILFSVLLMTSMILFRNIGTVAPADISKDWLARSANSASLALSLVPFAGIAFLWFTGVIRDWLGDREDKLFATVFLGSGLIFVVLLFIWAATLGAILGIHAAAATRLIDDDVYIFGATFMNEIIGNYTLRMAGVYMLSISSLWTRTGVMPRWLTIITTIVALGYLFFAGSVREARYIFPAWVFLISVYILVLNYRRTHNLENKDALSPDD